ncbi:MAG: translation initiation factor IF-2, partial [Planctomycetota bacterium]
SAATGVKAAEIVKKLFMQGVMANINSGIETEVAQEIMIDYDIELEVVEAKTAEQQVSEQFEDREIIDERPRGPVVTILGHVDHGKTSLLDKIRDANVAAGEAGGITQATSAFRVPLKIGDEDRTIVFLDTPGHEAFTSMRARGANMTDIVVLVVAADDGVMPQTAESISHAKAAGVPIVVALNKIDKPEATDSNIQKILGQLAEHELNPVDWGGETEVVRTSAIKGEGIQELLEILDLQAQVLELKADFGGAGRGTVIEARTQEGRGSVANLLLQEGELKVGQFVVAGRAFGRVRDITTDRGERMKSATPPMPVQISGIDGLPDAGDKFYIVDTLKQAEQAAQQRRDTEREAQLAAPKMTTLDSMFSAMADKAVKEIRVVLKADVQGSVDVLRGEIEKVLSDEVRCRVLHSAIGGVTESDVLLAEASEAVIVGFNVIPSGKARNLAEQKGVQ